MLVPRKPKRFDEVAALDPTLNPHMWGEPLHDVLVDRGQDEVWAVAGAIKFGGAQLLGDAVQKDHCIVRQFGNVLANTLIAFGKVVHLHLVTSSFVRGTIAAPCVL